MERGHRPVGFKQPFVVILPACWLSFLLRSKARWRLPELSCLVITVPCCLWSHPLLMAALPSILLLDSAFSFPLQPICRTLLSEAGPAGPVLHAFSCLLGLLAAGKGHSYPWGYSAQTRHVRDFFLMMEIRGPSYPVGPALLEHWCAGVPACLVPAAWYLVSIRPGEPLPWLV